MKDADDTERELRLELMHLDRELKRLDIRLTDQKIAYLPIKVMFLVGCFALVFIAAAVFVA